MALIFTKHMGLMSPKLVIANILCLYGKAAGNISSVAVQKVNPILETGTAHRHTHQKENYVTIISHVSTSWILHTVLVTLSQRGYRTSEESLKKMIGDGEKFLCEKKSVKTWPFSLGEKPAKRLRYGRGLEIINDAKKWMERRNSDCFTTEQSWGNKFQDQIMCASLHHVYWRHGIPCQT